MKPYQYPPVGINAPDLEQINERIAGDLEAIDEIFPADSEGNHLSMGNSIMHTISQMADGTIEPRAGGPEIVDPPVSQAQRRAMYAAAEGHSNLGIPQKVGKEFTKDDHAHNLPERKGKK
jgi:hypothetical protein